VTVQDNGLDSPRVATEVESMGFAINFNVLIVFELNKDRRGRREGQALYLDDCLSL